MKYFLTFGWILLIAIISNAQTSVKNLSKEFQKVAGSWTGSLTYLDYSSGKPYTMPANLAIRRLGKTNVFLFSNIYPNETNANSTDTLTISVDGNHINNESVKSVRQLSNGDTEIITEVSGKDGNDNQPAIIRHTYTLGGATFKKAKDVQFVGETKWINRHEYSYKKQSGR